MFVGKPLIEREMESRAGGRIPARSEPQRNPRGRKNIGQTEEAFARREKDRTLLRLWRSHGRIEIFGSGSLLGCQFQVQELRGAHGRNQNLHGRAQRKMGGRMKICLLSRFFDLRNGEIGRFSQNLFHELEGTGHELDFRPLLLPTYQLPQNFDDYFGHRCRSAQEVEISLRDRSR